MTEFELHSKYRPTAIMLWHPLLIVWAKLVARAASLRATGASLGWLLFVPFLIYFNFNLILYRDATAKMKTAIQSPSDRLPSRSCSPPNAALAATQQGLLASVAASIPCILNALLVLIQ